MAEEEGANKSGGEEEEECCENGEGECEALYHFGTRLNDGRTDGTGDPCRKQL